MEYIEIPCCKGPGLKIRVKGLIHKSRSQYQEIVIYDTEPFGKCLILDDLIQCAEGDHELYDRAILQKIKPSDQRLLILGGGDGYTAEMALKLNPEIEITVVDLDGAVVNACKKYLGQTVFDHQKVNLVVDDAFHFMAKAGEGCYDGIVCDLTDFPVGYNDGKLRGFFTQIFSLSKRILKDNGWIGVYAGSKNLSLATEGCVLDILSALLEQNFTGVKQQEALIPSFGEPCYFLYGEKAIGESGKFKVEVLKEATDDIVNQLMKLARLTYPISSNGDDASEYYADLNNQEYINIVLKRRDEIIGYLLAVPQNAACGYQKGLDPLMAFDDDRYYIDTVQTTNEHNYGGKILLNRLIQEITEKEIVKLSLHARKTNGTSRVIHKIFPAAKCLRTVENFENTGEPFDYIEINLNWADEVPGKRLTPQVKGLCNE